MTREQAALLIRDVDALPKSLGAGYYWHPDGQPCDAVGHLMGALGRGIRGPVLVAFEERYGIEPLSLIYANDLAPAAARKAAVVSAAESAVRELGFDPDDLRRLVAL